MNWVRHHVINIKKKLSIYVNRKLSICCMHASFLQEIGGLLAGSSQSKQIKLLYRYNYERQDKYRRIIVLSIWKLHFHSVYFKVYVTISEARQSLSNDNAYANCWKSLLLWILRGQRKITSNINPTRLLLINVTKPSMLNIS